MPVNPKSALFVARRNAEHHSNDYCYIQSNNQTAAGEGRLLLDDLTKRNISVFADLKLFDVLKNATLAAAAEVFDARRDDGGGGKSQRRLENTALTCRGYCRYGF